MPERASIVHVQRRLSTTCMAGHRPCAAHTSPPPPRGLLFSCWMISIRCHQHASGCLQKLEIPSVAKNMFRLVDAHAAEFLPYNFAYVEAEKLRAALEEHAS